MATSVIPKKTSLGEKSIAYIIDPSRMTKIEDPDSTKKGHFYSVISAASTSSAFGGVKAGGLYFCNGAGTALAAGDVAYEIELSTDDFLGFARDKSSEASKAVQDSTTDDDELKSSAIDPIPSITGSISGYNKMTGPNQVMARLKSQFANTAILNEDGSDYTYHEMNTPINNLLIIWNGKQISEGERFSASFVPCYLTSNSAGANYGSPQPCSFNYSALPENDLGCKYSYVESVWAKATS